jgi:protein NRD1
MSDLIQAAPDNQKDKISKLLDIWERSQTFPLPMVAALKQQLKSPKKGNVSPYPLPHRSVVVLTGPLRYLYTTW